MNISNITIRSTHEVLMELMDSVDETTRRNLKLQKQEMVNRAEKRASFQKVLNDALDGSKESKQNTTNKAAACATVA